MKFPTTSLALPLLFGLTGCIVHVGGDGPSWGGFHALRWSEGSGLRGDGDAAQEERTVGEFDRVEISGAFTVRIGVGGAYGLRLAGDANLLDHVTTRVEGRTLEVRPERSLSPVLPLELEISAPALDALAISGASTVDLAGFDGGSFDLALSGSSELRATGRVERLVLSLSGANEVDLGELVALEAQVASSGSSRVHLNVEERLSLSSSGSSSVEVRGGARIDSLDQSGSLRLDRRDD